MTDMVGFEVRVKLEVNTPTGKMQLIPGTLYSLPRHEFEKLYAIAGTRGLVLNLSRTKLSHAVASCFA